MHSRVLVEIQKQKVQYQSYYSAIISETVVNYNEWKLFDKILQALVDKFFIISYWNVNQSYSCEFSLNCPIAIYNCFAYFLP